MVEVNSLPDVYRALLVMTTTMLDAVTRENWPALFDLQRDYTHLSQRLIVKHVSPSELLKKTLTDQQQEEISQCISQIMRNQNQLKLAMLRRRSQLGELICQTASQHAQIKTYYQVAGML